MGAADGKRDILVVDDDDDVREILRLQLEAAGFSTRGASNGAEAMAEVRREPPGLVLLDMMMPVMSGAEFVAKIQDEEQLRDLPIVVITAWPQEAARLPVRGVLGKPLETQTLLDSVIGALS
jgi:CheY-like chemotaxis protein